MRASDPEHSLTAICAACKKRGVSAVYDERLIEQGSEKRLYVMVSDVHIKLLRRLSRDKRKVSSLIAAFVTFKTNFRAPLKTPSLHAISNGFLLIIRLKPKTRRIEYNTVHLASTTTSTPSSLHQVLLHLRHGHQRQYRRTARANHR